MTAVLGSVIRSELLVLDPSFLVWFLSSVLYRISIELLPKLNKFYITGVTIQALMQNVPSEDRS